MVGTRIEGRAYATLQDRDIHSLEILLQYLKFTFRETRNPFQLNIMLANFAQRESKKIRDFRTRIREMLPNIIELAQETNSKDNFRALIKSARDTALDNFIMGLKRELAVKVRGRHPNILQEASNLAQSENSLKETCNKFENQNRATN